MGFRLKRRESVAKGVRRIAREQVEAGIEEIDRQLDPEHVVHQLRKRCKKLRGLLRLVRESNRRLQRRENAVIRDAARSLAGARDAAVALRTLDKLATRTDEFREDELVEARRLIARSNGLARDDEDLELRLAGVRATFVELLDRISDWRFRGSDFEILRGGFESTCRSARRLMRAAASKPSPEAHHEWRKPVKDHWYHLRLLQPTWPELVRVERETAKELGERLGEEHDLFVLRERLDAGDEDHADAVQAIDREQRRLRRRAHFLGSRLFAESARARARRYERLWTVWRSRRRSAVRVG